MKRDEDKVAEFFKRRGFEPTRFSKQEQKRGRTPDFRVKVSEDACFFCEVKSIDQDHWLDQQFEAAPPLTLVGGTRPDPIYNRLTDDIHACLKQFDAVNPTVLQPNVLAFVNHDDQCGATDLVSVFTGKIHTGDCRPIPAFRQFSEGRIKEEKIRIHLILWFDDFEQGQMLFTQTSAVHHQNLCVWFGIDPNLIPGIGV